MAALNELRRGGEDFAAEAEEGENSYYFKIAPHDPFNFKIVRTDLGNIDFYLFICPFPELLVGPAFYFGFFVNWGVLTLCPWCVLILIWGLIVAYFFDYAEGFFPIASEEDKRHLTDET